MDLVSEKKLLPLNLAVFLMASRGSFGDFIKEILLSAAQFFMFILYTVVPLRINNATLSLGCRSVEYLLFLARIDLDLVVFEDEDQVCNHSSD